MAQSKITDYFKNELNEEKVIEILRKKLNILQQNRDIYLDVENILDDFKKSLIDNNNGIINRCTQCNVDMGQCNPRQLCGKTYCTNDY